MTSDEMGRFCALFLPATREMRETRWTPPIDLYSAPWGWLIKVDLAGVHRNDLEIGIADGRIVVRGVRRDTCLREECQSQVMEISYSAFERVIELPCRENSAIDLQCDEGMLLIRVLSEVENP
jgi:HSP20 family protein